MKNPEIHKMMVAIAKSGLPYDSRKNVYTTLLREITSKRCCEIDCYFDIDGACDEVLLEYMSDLFEADRVGC